MHAHYQDYDPFGRGPKGRLISSQPPPPHPNSIDETSFRPTSECSQPMFPDASFDVSTNKSTATCSNHRPLLNAHMPPPPLPPNTPSMYSRSIPASKPTSLHRRDKWDESHVPPSPMQIVMSRHSAPAHANEAREPHNVDYRPDPKFRQRGGDREEREPPPPRHYHNERFDDGQNQRYEYESNTDDYRHQHEAYHLPHKNNGYHSNQELSLRNTSIETQHGCNCENCSKRLQHEKSQHYMSDGCLQLSYHKQDVHDERDGQKGNNSFHIGEQRQEFSEADHQRRYERRDPLSRQCDRFDERPDYAHEQLQSYYRGGQGDTFYDKIDHGHHHGYNYSERRSPPSESPLSQITFDERRQGWSPTSDNATLHADTFHATHYGAGTSSHDRKEFTEHNYYDNRRYLGGPPHNEEAYNNQRDANFDHGRNNDRGDGHIPSHVSYQSHDSRLGHHRSNTSPDRRDDYSGSTIPTYSTVTPRRASNSPHPYLAQHEARPNLRVDIPISPNIPPNNTQPLVYHQHERHITQPNTSRSCGHFSVPTPNHRNRLPSTTHSYPTNHSHRTQQRVAVAEREREKSEVRHQLLKEIHQATDMRNSALDDNDRRFWDRQIATLNKSFKHL